MKIKIVADSSANLYTLDGGVDFSSAPLTIRTNEREFVDTEALDKLEMVEYLSKYKGSTIGICYSQNIKDELFHGKFDRTVDMIVTEKQIITIKE